MSIYRVLAWAALAAAGLSCATSYTNLSDPHALAPGHLEVTVAGQGAASSVLVAKSWQGGESLYDMTTGAEPPALEAAADPALIDAALAWALFTPSADPELLLRCGVPAGPFPGLDLGLRISPSILKLDGKWQLWSSATDRHAVALQAGYGWHHSGPYKQLEWLALTEFEHHDVDVMATWGWRAPDIFELYLGPRTMVSVITAKPKLEAELMDALAPEVSQLNPSHLFRDEWMLQAGATLGAKLGYRYLFVRAEISAFYMWFHPLVLGRERDFDGLVLSPSIALSGTW